MSNEFVASLIPLALVFAIFWFLVIRPQRQEEEERRKMRDSLQHGDRVVTSSGIHGVVVGTKDKTVTLKIAERTHVEFEKSAIQARLAEPKKT